MRAALRRGEIDDITKPENKTARYKELDKEFDALVKEQREHPRQERVRPDLHEGRRVGDERLDEHGPHPVLHHRAEEQARALDVDGVGPPERARLPRVLRRARRRLRGAAPADRVDADGQPRGGVRGDVLARPPVLLARGRVRLGHPRDHEGAGGRVLRALLRAEQHHGHPRRRLRPEGGARARREVLRAHSAREEPAPRDDAPPAEVGGGDAAERRGRHEPAGRRSTGTPCRSSTRTPTRCRSSPAL